MPESNQSKRHSSDSTAGAISILQSLIRENSCKHTLEIGLANGISAVAILEALSQCNESGFSHTALDPFQATVWNSNGVSRIATEGYEAHFHFLEHYSAVALPDLLHQNKQYDLIYIDGSHLFEDVLVDLYYSLRLIPVDGFIMFDDCTDKHVRKVIRFVESNLHDILVPVRIEPDGAPGMLRKVARLLGYRQNRVYRKVKDHARAWNSSFKDF